MSEPRTEAGRTLLAAFSVKAEDQDFAIRISQASVIRHAVPAIEAEAATLDVGRLARALERQHEAFLAEPESFDSARAVASFVAAEYERLGLEGDDDS